MDPGVGRRFPVQLPCWVVRPLGLEPRTCGLRAGSGVFSVVPNCVVTWGLSWGNAWLSVMLSTDEYLWITRDHGTDVTTS